MALGILVVGLGAGIYLVNQNQNLAAKAGPTDSPKNVKISNRSSTGYSVSWTTDIPVTGVVKYSENPAQINIPAGDIRDQVSGTAQGYTSHYVAIAGLLPEKTYYFVIGSGSAVYDDGGKPFQIRTSSQVIAPPEDVITGKILTANNEPVNGAIVYVEVEGADTLSTVTKVDGTWRLNLANSRDTDGKVLNYNSTTATLSIFVQGGVSGTATAITSTAKAKPVPDIVMGKNQSFVDGTVAAVGQTTITPAPTGANSASGGFKTIADSTTAIGGGAAETQTATPSMKLLNPAIDGEMIATSSPEFKGKAAPGSDIKISVHSATELTQNIKADSQGNWNWTPPANLEPGEHTLTVQYKDAKGILQTITRSFTVLAADRTGGLPSFTATPSSVITLTPTATPSATISPTLTSMPSTASGVPQTGVLTPTLLIFIVGIGLFILGQLSKKWTIQIR